MLSEVIKNRAYKDIVKQIMNLIESGRLKRGDRLPTERELSETFKLSRATVREAIMSLETLKFVERRQGEGTYVIASCEEALIQPLASALYSERDDLTDIFYLRKIIEPELAYIAAENATMEEITELENVIKHQKHEFHYGGQNNQYAAIHYQLARMAKNRILERLLLALACLLGKTTDQYLQTRERQEQSLKSHLRILAAIKSRDSKTARNAMREHLEQIEMMFFKQTNYWQKTVSK